MGTYKPGPQARFLVKHMVQSEKTLLDSITKLTEQLTSMEQKADKFSGDLNTIQTKVDLAIQSIGLVQQEQVHVAKLLSSGVAGSTVQTPESVMGPFPSSGTAHPSLGALMTNPCHDTNVL
jgi:hypothetical protein